MNNTIKAQQREYKITTSDVVVVKGNAYTLITQDYWVDGYKTKPKLSKTKCLKWIKEKALVYVGIDERNNKLYKFDLEKLSLSKIR